MLILLNERSKKLFIEAKKVIPGGVNSPVRAFKSVGGDPIFIKKVGKNEPFELGWHFPVDFSPILFQEYNPEF